MKKLLQNLDLLAILFVIIANLLYMFGMINSAFIIICFVLVFSVLLLIESTLSVKKIWKWLQSKWFAEIDFKEPNISFLYKKGTKVWECDLITGNVVEAEYEMVAVGHNLKGETIVKRKVIMKDNCLYEFAINGENAVRKFENKISKSFKK